jgi:predicted dehydrogenase
VVLRYPGGDDEARQKKLTTRLAVNARGANGKISVAIIGAGSFAKATHLPNIKKLSDKYHLRAIVDADGRNAKAAAERFGAEYATTDYTEVLADDKVDMVLIATRHNLHARLAMEAARAGKAILLEKPMALNQTELDELLGVLRQTSVSFMMGFNRRFAPAARRAKEIIGEHQHPLMILYRVNAGYLPPDHWTQTTEGGGRIIGEACHIFDLFQYFAGAPVAEVGALAIHPNTDHILAGDNVSVTVRYEDGSVATLLYTALGPSGLSKEYMELYADGKALVLDDYRALRVYGVQAKGWTAAAQDKGHLEELATFGENLQKGAKYIIPLDVLQDVTQLTFIVGSAANAGGHHARHGAY